MTVIAAPTFRVLLAVIAAIAVGQLASGEASAQTPPDQPPVTVPDDPTQPAPTLADEPTVPSALPTLPTSSDEGPLPDGDSLIPALPAETLTHPTMNYDIGYDKMAELRHPELDVVEGVAGTKSTCARRGG